MPASAVIEIPSGSISVVAANQDGQTYVLTGDITVATSAIVLGASNVTFDGMGYSITYGTTGSGYGLYSATARDNVTITNVTVLDGGTGSTYSGVYMNGFTNSSITDIDVTVTSGKCIYLLNGTNNNIAGVSISGVTGSALLLSGETNTTLNDVESVCEFDGGYIYQCDYINIDNSRFSGGRDGLYFKEVRYSNINNVLGDGDRSGFHLNDCADNIFTDCIGSSSVDKGVFFESVDGNVNTFVNNTVTSPYANYPVVSDVHILAFGDSITQGGTSGTETTALGGYCTDMQTALNSLSSGYVVSNAGIAGDTSGDIRARFLDELAIYQPDAISIFCGVNDLGAGRSIEDIITDISWMESTANEMGITPYIVLIPASGNAYNNNIITLDELLDSSVNCLTVNIYDSLDSDPFNGEYDDFDSDNYIDNVHPNNASYVIIGQHIARQITTRNEIVAGVGVINALSSTGIVERNRDVYAEDAIINFDIVSWSTTKKVWTLSSTTQQSVTLTIGGFPANTDIDIYRDGIDYATVHSNSKGVITWVYDGGFSTHTFEAIAHPTAGARDSFVSSWGNTVSMVGAIIVIALAGSMIAVFRGKRDISDVVNDLPGIILVVVLLIVGAIIFGQF